MGWKQTRIGLVDVEGHSFRLDVYLSPQEEI